MTFAFGAVGWATRTTPGPPSASVSEPAQLLTEITPAPRTVYEGTWPGWEITMLGLDRKRSDVVLELLSDDGAVPRLAYDTIGWDSGELTSHVFLSDATARARSRKGQAPHWEVNAPTFPADIALVSDRLARLDRDEGGTLMLGPNGSLVIPDVAASDHLWLIDGKGKPVRHLDEGLYAAYDPVASPNGATVAVDGWPGGTQNYALYLLDASGAAAPVRVNAVDHPQRCFFTDDGRFVIALARPKTSDETAELWRVPIADPNHAELLVRNVDMHRAQLFPSTDHGVAVLATTSALRWYDVTTGAETARVSRVDHQVLAVGSRGAAFGCDRDECMVDEPGKSAKVLFATETGWRIAQAAWAEPSKIVTFETRTGEGFSPMRYRIRVVTVAR